MTPLALCLLLVAADADRDALERKFRETLANATLAGSFTIDGKAGPPAEDRYEIAKASKLAGDKWEIVARIKYGKIDVKVPVPVEVKWAGDTATIQLTDLELPLMKGKFRTRLMIDGDRYAGTWAHDHVGGHMWGKIVKSAPPAAGTPKEAPAARP